MCFFSFLSSQLLDKHDFMNGIDFYGSYLGIQEKYKMNIADDIEYLSTSDFFNENVGKYFTISEDIRRDFGGAGSRANKHKLHISESNIHNISAVCLDELDETICESVDESNVIENNEEIVYEKSSSSNSSATSTNSSNNSEVNYSDDSSSDQESESGSDSESDQESESGSDSESDKESESGSESEESNHNGSIDDSDNIFAYIPNFPIQMICLENCKGTIDSLFVRGALDEDEGASALFQIVMTLITYQKAFSFTHNDLHTNNIMYIDTEIDYLYYKYDGQIYKVPTYGKIYKIIDFGRSIYKFGGNLFCSDSFAIGGDAATQYNFEPFMNEKKPRLEPNMSFDLCRLGCSMYDFLLDGESEDEMDDFQKTISRWCTDDNGKNILYKRDGEERYPNFKLYKMIARTVHNHIPKEQLSYPFFNQFLLSKKQQKMFSDDDDYVMNIDAIPSYA